MTGAHLPQSDKGEFTGSCPIREHTGDGAYVGRCDYATYDRICPRHGLLEDYPDNDDRAVDPSERRHDRVKIERIGWLRYRVAWRDDYVADRRTMRGAQRLGRELREEMAGAEAYRP